MTCATARYPLDEEDYPFWFDGKKINKIRFCKEFLWNHSMLCIRHLFHCRRPAPEFIGYCLIPSTKGQKMLISAGRDGEGKSRIGLVMYSLLGGNMNTGSIDKVETNPFARSDLDHELLMVDDDMKLEALPQTNNIKAIVTAELPMDLEKKGTQSYQGQLYVRFLG